MSVLKEVQDLIEEAGQLDKIVELNLSDIKIKKFTEQIKKAIEKCTNLEILILSGCELESLDNLPDGDLTAIDFTGNKLGDGELAKLTKYPNLGQLIFNENNITKVDSIKPLAKLENLQQVDFSDNPVASLDDYREKVLEAFDRQGNEQVEEDEFEDYDDDGDDQQLDDEDGDDDDGEDLDEDQEDEESPPPKKKR